MVVEGGDVFGDAAVAMVIGAVDADRRRTDLDNGGEGLCADEAVFSIPSVGKTAVGKKVAILVVGEQFGVVGDEEGAGFGGNEVGIVGVIGGQGGSDGEGLEDGAGGVINIVAAVEEGRDLGGRVVVDRGQRAGV